MSIHIIKKYVNNKPIVLHILNAKLTTKKIVIICLETDMNFKNLFLYKIFIEFFRLGLSKKIIILHYNNCIILMF